MNSIAPKRGYWQPVKARQPQVYPDGIRLHKQGGMVFVGSHLSGEDKVKRGEISEFSAGSRRRLRAALLELSIPGALRCGITLTVPWKGTDFAPLMDEWRQCLDRFAKSFRRRFPHSAYIFRVELQQRGAPHAHALAYIALEDIAPAPAPPRVGGRVPTRWPSRALGSRCAVFGAHQYTTYTAVALAHLRGEAQKLKRWRLLGLCFAMSQIILASASKPNLAIRASNGASSASRISSRPRRILCRHRAMTTIGPCFFGCSARLCATASRLRITIGSGSPLLGLSCAALAV